MSKSTEMYPVNSCYTLTLFFLKKSHYVYSIPIFYSHILKKLDYRFLNDITKYYQNHWFHMILTI